MSARTSLAALRPEPTADVYVEQIPCITPDMALAAERTVRANATSGAEADRFLTQLGLRGGQP